MKNAFSLLALACLVTTPVRAQSPKGSPSPGGGSQKPIMPAGPLLRPAADYSQWDVTFTYPDDAKKDKSAATPKVADPAADARPRKTAVTKTGPVIHESMTDVLNRSTDIWFKGTTQYTKLNDDPTWYQAEPGIRGTSNYHPLPANGFRDLDWINAANFAGTIPYGNGQCLVFTPGGYQNLDLSEPAEREKRLTGVKVVAYIDADARMPVAVRTVSELRVYHFNPPPTAMQDLPADLAEQIKKGDDGRAQLNRPAARPY